MNQMDECDVFINKGHKENLSKILTTLDGFKKISTHISFAVRHDGRHKARLVLDGHLTNIPLTSVYSRVESLRDLATFIAELNDLRDHYWQCISGS